MKVEVFEEGIVVCDSSICVKWVDSETTCVNCPIDILFTMVMEYYAGKEQGKLKLNHEVHDDNRH